MAIGYVQHSRAPVLFFRTPESFAILIFGPFWHHLAALLVHYSLFVLSRIGSSRTVRAATAFPFTLRRPGSCATKSTPSLPWARWRSGDHFTCVCQPGGTSCKASAIKSALVTRSPAASVLYCVMRQESRQRGGLKSEAAKPGEAGKTAGLLKTGETPKAAHFREAPSARLKISRGPASAALCHVLNRTSAIVTKIKEPD
jgi:hypothetical protein